MSTKKQISSLCKLYSVYEEKPDDLLDKTDVDSYFFYDILDISQCHHRVVRVSKRSKKNLLHSKCFIFAIQSYSSDLFSRKKSAFPKKIESLLDSLVEFLKAFDQVNKVSQVTLPKPKFEIGFTKAKDELFSHCYKDIAEHLNRQILLSCCFEKNKTCVFSIKTFDYWGDQLQKVSSWVTAKPNISTRYDFLLLTKLTFLRAVTMCSAFTPDCGSDNSTIILIGDVYCPNTKFSGKLCLHKKTFQSPDRNDYQCPQCASVCQVRKFPSEDQTNSFFFSFA